jgi:hypothetical protein
MFMLEDVETIQRLTRMSEEEITSNAALEAEYMIRLRFFHIDGGKGPLKGSELVNCLRHVGIEPPAAKRHEEAAVKVNWADVELLTKVVVTKTVTAGGKSTKVRLLGDYLGMFDIGRVAVRFGKNPQVEEFSVSQIELAPQVLADDVKIDGEEFVVTPQDRKAEAEQAAEYDEVEKALPALDPADLSGRRRAPKLRDLAWHDMVGGEPVLVEVGGETLEGKFVDVGPKDGQIQVYVPDRDGQRSMVVKEAQVAAV